MKKSMFPFDLGSLHLLSIVEGFPPLPWLTGGVGGRSVRHDRRSTEVLMSVRRL